jgi:hypothetical protein
MASKKQLQDIRKGTIINVASKKMDHRRNDENNERCC